MQPTDVIEWVTDPLPELHRPILLMALEGLFDAANAATEALAWIRRGRATATVASIDPDPFYDFTQQRPTVRLENDERVIDWPANEFHLVRHPAGKHDLIVLAGVEPHVRWACFADSVLTIAERLGCQVIVTVGGAPEQVPHTRVPQVFGSTMNGELARRLGLSKPQYQGVTGVAGVLHARLDARNWPAIALRAPVPHYINGGRHPAATRALLQHLEHVLAMPFDHAGMQSEVDEWSELHDRAVADDPRAAAYVRMLELEFDRRLERSVSPGDELAAEFERFLRELGDDG